MIFRHLHRAAIVAFFLCLLAILSLPAISTAGTAEDTLLEQGNEAFSRGNYHEAIASYEQLIDQAGFSAPVLYNLANSYALAGKTGQAVLNYERALRLAPGDSDISGNLELLRKECGLFAGDATLAERTFRLLHPDQWALLSLLALVLFTLFRLSALKVRFSGKAHGTVAVLCLLVLVFGAAGTLFRHRHFNPAVVVVPDGRLLVSPFPSAASIGAIQEGRLVYPDKEYGDFVHVTDETQRKGWIPRKSVIRVVPRQESAGGSTAG